MTKTPGLRPVTKEDLAGIHSLLQSNLHKFHLSPILSLQEIEHWLLPRENVIDAYVVEVKVRLPYWGKSFHGHLISCCFTSPPHTQEHDGTLTGVVSFYSVYSRVLNHPVHTGLRTAHLLYIASTATDLVDLMEDTLVLAKSVSVAEYKFNFKLRCNALL